MSSTPAVPGTSCCSTRPCTWSTARRCPSPTPSRPSTGDLSGEQFQAVAHRVGCRRRARRERAAVRGDVLPRPRRRPHPGRSRRAGVSDRRLDRRGRRRRPLELPRAHQRHRRLRSRSRSTSGDAPKQIRVTDLFEEVADEQAQARPRRPRGGDQHMVAGTVPTRAGPACRRSPPPWWRCAAATGSPSCSPHLRRAGHRHRRADAEPVDRRAARRGRARQRPSGGDPAEQQEHHPRRRAGERRSPRKNGARRARRGPCPRRSQR